MLGNKKLKKEIEDLKRRVAFLEDVMGKPYIIMSTPKEKESIDPDANPDPVMTLRYSPPCPRCGRDDHWNFGDQPCLNL